MSLCGLLFKAYCKCLKFVFSEISDLNSSINGFPAKKL